MTILRSKCVHSSGYVRKPPQYSQKQTSSFTYPATWLAGGGGGGVGEARVGCDLLSRVINTISTVAGHVLIA